MADTTTCVYVPQSSLEAQYFAYLWSVANPNVDKSGDEGLLGGQAAVNFFRLSGVDTGFLKQIWNLSTHTSTMNAQQFFTALRFVAMIQNGAFPISKGTKSFTCIVSTPFFRWDSGTVR